MRLTSFNIKTWMKAINELLAFKDSLRSGDGLIQVIGGNSFKINVDRLRARIPKVAGGGTGIIKAYAKADAGTGNTIVCYKDSDSHDEDDEITVTCEIVGGSDLNSAIPRLENGDLIHVYYDAGTWTSIMTFQASGDC